MSPLNQSSTKCTICGQRLGTSWYVSDLGDAFCVSHRNPSFCQGCRRPMPLAATETMCTDCTPTLFSHESQIDRSRQDVLTWLSGHIGPNRLNEVPVTLENSSSFSQNQTGVTNWTFDGRQFDVNIRILRNVTPNIFEHTLAHEYGHVLLVAEPDSLSFRGAFPDHRHVEEEGFCEVVKYLWLQECGTGHRDLDQRDMRNNPDPVYGDGFRLVWKEYEKIGSITGLRAHMLGITGPLPKRNIFSILRPKQTPTPVAPPVSDTGGPQTVPPPLPMEGGSHRPTREFTPRSRQQPQSPASSGDTPRPMVTVKFTRRDSNTGQETVDGTTDRPMRTIKRPPRT
jgi:hypothetical protein